MERLKKRGFFIPMREAWGIIVLTYERGKREVRRAVCPEQAVYGEGGFLSSAAFGGKRRGYVCAYVRVRGDCGSLFSVDIVWAWCVRARGSMEESCGFLREGKIECVGTGGHL